MTQEIWIVINAETDEPKLLGEYLHTDEGVVFYLDTDGSTRQAPDDCVWIVVATWDIPANA